jgi:hypothetical protein
MRVRIFGLLPLAVLALIFLGPASDMRADVIFSNFGPSQTYQGGKWWTVGNSPGFGTQDVAFSFTPTATAAVTGADLALSSDQFSAGVAPLILFIESDLGGTPGTILGTLTQTESYPSYPTTAVVNFACSGSCSTLDAGTNYWLVAQQTDPTDESDWLFSFGDTGTWYYDETGSGTGPWTAATVGNQIGAFDVTGNAAPSPTPEPGSLALLGSGLVGILAVAKRRVSRA